MSAPAAHRTLVEGPFPPWLVVVMIASTSLAAVVLVAIAMVPASQVHAFLTRYSPDGTVAADYVASVRFRAAVCGSLLAIAAVLTAAIDRMYVLPRPARTRWSALNDPGRCR